MWFPEDFLGVAGCGEPCGEWASRSVGAIGVILWLFLFLEQNIMEPVIHSGTGGAHQVLDTEATR